MTSPSDALHALMVARLRALDMMPVAIAEARPREEPREFPYASIGVTGADEASGSISLLATVHFWDRSGDASTRKLLKKIQSAFVEPPTVDGYEFVTWAPDYSEIRAEDEYSAFHGLARFSAQIQRRPDWQQESAV
jgi:hypothetical protein